MRSVQEQTDARSSWEIRGKYVLYFVSWIAFVVLGFLLLASLRTNVENLMWVVRINPWAMSAVHNFSIVIIALVMLGLIIVVENYLRIAVQKNLLLRRVVISLGSLLIFHAGSLALGLFLASKVPS